MSKYVNKKHGLIVGSDNIFFITHDEEAPEGVEQFRDGYRAIVWARGYNFKQINMLNVFVRTPAQQLLWDEKEEIVIEKWEDREFSSKKQYLTLNKWWRNWLEKEIGPIHDKWDIRSKVDRSRGSDSVFFKRRTDALKFVRKIEEVLKGIKISD